VERPVSEVANRGPSNVPGACKTRGSVVGPLDWNILLVNVIQFSADPGFGLDYSVLAAKPAAGFSIQANVSLLADCPSVVLCSEYRIKLFILLEKW
jgi:hypothetical protein